MKNKKVNSVGAELPVLRAPLRCPQMEANQGGALASVGSELLSTARAQGLFSQEGGTFL